MIQEQGTLPGLAPRRRNGRRKEPEPAPANPVAVVSLDLSTPHLDRTFDYMVPARLDAAAQPGVRVRCRFGGRSVAGFIVERRDRSEHPGRLAPISRVPSGLPLLTPGLWRLAQAVAARSAGVVADVLRLAIPAAHVETEKRLVDEWRGVSPATDLGDGSPGQALPGLGARADSRGPGGPAGPEPARRGPQGGGLPEGESGPAVPDPPGHGPPEWPAQESGGSAVPSSLGGFLDGLGRWLDAARTCGGWDSPGAATPPRAAWNFLPGDDFANGLTQAVKRIVGADRQVLVVAPNERDVGRIGAALARRAATARLVAGDGPAARLEGYWAAASGRADVLVGTRAAAYAPLARPGLLVLVGDGDSALDEPHAPYAGARAVMTVRAGQERAALLIGGLARTVEAQALVESGWMGAAAAPRAAVRAAVPRISAPTAEHLAREGPTAHARLPSAAFDVVRRGLEGGPVLVQVPSAEHEVFGLGRTAADLGRAFPETAVKRSAAQPGVLDGVGPESQLVVATPGAEPPAEGGYAAAVLLDGGALASRPELDASVDALRVWMGAAGLVRGSGEGMLVGSGGGAAAQALVRWDPAWLAERELAERRELGLPPATKAAVIAGTRADAGDLLARVHLPEGTRVVPGESKTVVLFPLDGAWPGVAALRAAVRARSIARHGGPARVKVDGKLDQ